MNSSNSGKKLEKFFAGKGFYIVLFLCAAVIGVSTWMLASGNETMDGEALVNNTSGYENRRVETIIVPGEPESESVLRPEDGDPIEVMAPPVNKEGLAGAVRKENNVSEEGTGASETSAQQIVWPVEGSLERAHSTDTLAYDVTLRDWRTHAGVDIAAELGTPVVAAGAGTVESIVSDSLYGTVLTLNHGNDFRTVYANLSEYPAVSVGQWVEPGVIIGSVGDTALCEIAQESHLHFAVEVDRSPVDPMEYLPA